MKTLLQTLNKKQEKPQAIPVWIMRQAGRYLPEYRELRAKAKGFMDLANNSQWASEITLQPLRRFDLDAAITFADILHIPYALGQNVDFKPGIGPVLNKIETQKDLDKLAYNLNSEAFLERLEGVLGNIRLTKHQLAEDKSLIGFCGAPWTVATYMIEGSGSKDYRLAKQMIYSKPVEFDYLMDILIKASAKYLIEQIKNGVEVVKIFDSWAGVLTDDQARKYSFEPMLKIASLVKQAYPDVPVILFPKGVQRHLLKELVEKYNFMFDCLALGQNIDAQWAADNLQKHICLQGNLDPALMICDAETVYTKTAEMVNIFKNGRYIANLGHGVTPDTKIENIEAFIKAVRDNS